MLARIYTLERSQEVPRPLDEVFAYFSDARNLERLTPDFLRFEILTPGPIPIKTGTLIEYRIRIFGIPRRWRTLIEAFTPPREFIDVQLSGPYRSWRHRHEFEAIPAGTRLRDRVEYELPLGPLGALAHAVFVRRVLERIFDHRRRVIATLFPAPSTH